MEASSNVQFQVPDEHTCVGYLINNIKYQDANVRAAVTQIRTNSLGTHDDFDRSVSILLLVDPFTKIPVNKNLMSFEISSVEATKFGRGRRSVVDLGWHTSEEFTALNKDQKTELRAQPTTVEGRNATKGDKDAYFQSKGDPKRKHTDLDTNKSKKLKRQVAALQKKKVDDHE